MRNGSYWESSYDDVARLTTRVLKEAAGLPVATDVNEFDRRGNLVRHTDPEGYVSSFSYDSLDRIKIATGPAAITGSAQQMTTTTYGATAKTLTTQNALGEQTVTTSDALGRPVTAQVKNASGAVVRITSFAYSADHNAVTVTEGTGAAAVSQTIYTDTAGRVVLSVAGDGRFTRNIYDLGGNLLSTIDPLNHPTSYTYNTLDQAVSQTLPDGTVTSFTADTAGNLLSRGMAGGSLNYEQTFDSAGRKLTEHLYSGTTNTRQFTYAYYPAGSAWVGLLQSVTAPRDTITTTYDGVLRPQAITTSGSLSETNGTTTYAYDRRSLVTSISQSSVGDAAGPATLVSRTYDGYGQLRTEAVTVAGSAFSSVTQTWDAAGRRASLNEAGSTLPAPLFAYQHRADGLLAQITANNQDHGFAYADSGLLTGRADQFRSVAVNSRDAAGRLAQQTTSVGGTAAMVESMTYRADGTLDTYGVARSGSGAWNEVRSYSYNPRDQLMSEGYSPAAGASSALTYAFDGSNPGLGVRTDARAGSGAPLSWEAQAAAIDVLGRVTQDQVNAAGPTIPANGIALGADHVDIHVDGISQGRARHPGWTDPTGAWSIDLSLAPGSHTLTASAVHPSGQYTATATSTFTVTTGGGGASGGTVTSAYDGDGNVISRTWSSGLTQALTWDAFGRLIKVTQRDTANNGYDWSAAYDGLGRRLKTTQQPVTAGTASGSPTVTTSIYDPQVEFLEIGVAVNGAKAWKVFGPDLNGRFGGLQGTGGLEATILDADGTTTGVINDQFGNGVATVTGTGAGATVAWNTTRVGAYGPLPGIQAQTLTDVSQLAATTAWRSRRIDPTGFYWLGARYYEPTSGRFLSADPMGHGVSPSLYDFCQGDPVNHWDPDGRCLKKISDWTRDFEKGFYIDPLLGLLKLNPISQGWDEYQRLNSVLSDPNGVWAGAERLRQAQIAGLEDFGRTLITPSRWTAEGIGEGTFDILSLGAAGYTLGSAALDNALAPLSDMRMSPLGGSWSTLTRPQLQLLTNELGGAEFADLIAQREAAGSVAVPREVSIYPYLDNGQRASFRFRADMMPISDAENAAQSARVIETKGSQTAPFTKRQAGGFPLYERNGGVIAGDNGGPFLPAGTVMPPSQILVIRPPIDSLPPSI